MPSPAGRGDRRCALCDKHLELNLAPMLSWEKVLGVCLRNRQLPVQGLDFVKHNGWQREEPAAILYDVTRQG